MMYSKTRDQDGSIVGGNKIHTKRTSPSSPPNIVFSKMKKMGGLCRLKYENME